MKSVVSKTIRQVKKLTIAVIGFTILLIGLAMVVLPGPAFIVIPVGLGILATEFVWARNLLKKVKTKFQNLKGGSLNG
ncbi:PGPGW domain-containing protein [Dissulfurispira sp.]|uniref:PGPGW domain-containing protein n=1 Tax=Dissulfurispira sp. TaxID=2817609 RepID=UPI002FDA9FF4